ncbi:MAG TPA: redox-sensing transcriptional repressor Rex [Gemmatimonadaceae bacterium]|nr:redox-sensing transcriptional repressor Rex [Gemmatimonadaceae bacterium]
MSNQPPAPAPEKHIAESTVRRLSLYLRVLEQAANRGQQTISSDLLAEDGGTTSAQVRKDLSFFGSFGKRGRGYDVVELVSQLQEILGLGREWKVYIVGAGKIGSALVSYRGFSQRGFRVLGIYDNNPQLVGRMIDGVGIRSMAQLEHDAVREQPDIAVLTVPAEHAQGVADRVVNAGVRAIMNFAPVPLHVPASITVKSVNMALELEGLAYALVHRDAGQDAR